MEIKCAKEDFYKNNLSKCKECRKVESRNGKFSKNDVLVLKIQ